MSIRTKKAPSAREVRRRAAQSKGGVLLGETKAQTTVITYAYPIDGGRGVSPYWHQSIIRMLGSMGGKFNFRPLAAERPEAQARNAIVDQFLTTEDPFLLMMTTDVAFAPEDIASLHAADSPIAGALYYDAATGSAPWCTALVEVDGPTGVGEGVEQFTPSQTYRPLDLPELPEPPSPPDEYEGEKWVKDAEGEPVITTFEADMNAYLVELAGWTNHTEETLKPQVVAGVGMGLTLIKREVVEEVRKIYSRPFEDADDNGEDLTFCLRAKEMGFDTVVVPKARVGHVKATVL